MAPGGGTLAARPGLHSRGSAVSIVSSSLVLYNHGVKVSEAELEATSNTWHGGWTKPTFVFRPGVRRMSFTVRKKQAELRAAALHWDRYSEAMVQKATSGYSWYSDLCGQGVVLFLCCYENQAKLYDGNRRVGAFDVRVAEGDVLALSLCEGAAIFELNGEDVVRHPLERAQRGEHVERCLAVQFHAVGDAVELDRTSYNHGVRVDGCTLTALCKTKHGQPEKPTVLFNGPLAFRIVKKQAELRIGLVDPELYMAAIAAGTAGQSWYSKGTGVALWLCFYADRSILFDGNDMEASIGRSAVEGDVVAVHRDGGRLCFTVNGSEVVATAKRTSGLFGVQFHTTGDAVELVTAGGAAPSQVGPAPGGSSVSQDLPPVWTASLPPDVQERIPPDGFLLRPMAAEEAAFALIQRLFTVTAPGELHNGRDVSGSFPAYDGIRPVAAWQVMGWRNLTYESARELLARKMKHRTDLVARKVPSKLDPYLHASLTLDEGITEKLLLHGTGPDKVIPILANGLNERFSGGLFGNGTYLAEEVEKIDQYVHMDPGFDASGELADLHARLYGFANRHPRNCFYAFACRAVLGCSVSTKDGRHALESGVGSVWAVPNRELALVPNSSPPEHFHSMVVELGEKIKRHREFVVFHSDRILPEFLVAFHRTNAGTVVS